MQAAAVHGIRILVAHDHEGLAGEAAARGPRRRGCSPRPRRQVVDSQKRISSWLRRPLRSSGPSKAGGVGWLASRCRVNFADAHRYIPVTLRDSGSTASISGEYQSLARASPGHPAATRRACRATGTCGRCAPWPCRSGTATAAPCRTGREIPRSRAHRRRRRPCRRCRDRSPTARRCSTAREGIREVRRRAGLQLAQGS